MIWELKSVRRWLLLSNSFKERSQKVRALSDPNMRFVPFFGSSEWLRFDGAHPAVFG